MISTLLLQNGLPFFFANFIPDVHTDSRCSCQPTTVTTWHSRECQAGIPRKFFHGIHNPFQKPIENFALSAKWNVHIWNRLRECYSSLYAGTLRTNGSLRSKFRLGRLKFQLELTWQPFALVPFLLSGMPRAARRATYSVNSVNLVLLDLLSSSRLLEVRTVTFSNS